MKLKLQVGKTYRTRIGNSLVIIDYEPDDLYPYKADDGASYLSNGREYSSHEASDDLIEEVISSRVGETKYKVGMYYQAQTSFVTWRVQEIYPTGIQVIACHPDTKEIYIPVQTAILSLDGKHPTDSTLSIK